ncbi:MAG: Ig-like domain-containing protein, partial [Clostridia bacterium]|nr:Ig-like domain-containing protein [Clostridia bacterium]
MRKSTKLLAILLAILMVVSVFPVSVFAADNVITAVDTSELVMETVFPYSPSEGEAFWNKSYASNVSAPTFYPTIPATVDGVETDLPVTWVSEDYQSTVFGTYTFTAVADGYTWECDAPTITVKVVDAGLNTANTRIFGFSAANGDIIPVVLRDGTSGTAIYDATGYNRLLVSYDIPYNSTNDYNFFAGVSSKSGTGKTTATSAEGDIRTILDGSNRLTRLYGGGAVAHKGDSYVYANDVTFVIRKSKPTGIYGGNYTGELDGNTYIYVSGTSTVPGVYGGGSATTVTGNANIDITGLPTITNIYGGGYGNSSVAGTATVTIHDLEEGASIGAISRGTASKLVVNLDDTSAGLLDKITDWETDANVTVYINGVVNVPAADYTAVEAAIAKIPTDLDNYTDETVQAVLDAEDAVEYGLDVTAQETVNAYAAAIEDAVAKLELKPADYTAVEEAKTKVPENLDAYTTATAQAVTDALDAVVYDLKITEQETVNA